MGLTGTPAALYRTPLRRCGRFSTAGARRIFFFNNRAADAAGEPNMVQARRRPATPRSLPQRTFRTQGRSPAAPQPGPAARRHTMAARASPPLVRPLATSPQAGTADPSAAPRRTALHGRLGAHRKSHGAGRADRPACGFVAVNHKQFASRTFRHAGAAPPSTSDGLTFTWDIFASSAVTSPGSGSDDGGSRHEHHHKQRAREPRTQGGLRPQPKGGQKDKRRASE